MVTNLRQREIWEGAPPSAGDTQKRGRLRIQCDELWSFVNNKGNKQWVWLALDANTREIVGVYIGARDEELLASYGNLRLRSIANVRLHTLIFGQRMRQFYWASVIGQRARRREKPATLSDLTTL